MNQYTVGDVVRFVMENRHISPLGFVGWDERQIATATTNCMNNGTLIYGVDEYGNINAVMLGLISNKDFRVINVLTTACGLGKQLVAKVAELFPQCETITFSKRGRERTHPLIERNLKHITVKGDQ